MTGGRWSNESGRWLRVDANGGEQSKDEALRDYKARVLDMQLSGEIDVVEVARRIKEGPPEGIKEVEANGAANGSGAVEQLTKRRALSNRAGKKSPAR